MFHRKQHSGGLVAFSFKAADLDFHSREVSAQLRARVTEKAAPRRCSRS
ncbi:MAG: hypothetical protein GPOALKHO_000867 [Sodalis sp.]|nr:MAG: hypothetical protein GPOALKHO_000867 [Sodalis sp.]